MTALSRHDVAVPSSFSLRRVSDDASFRRYFRAKIGERSWIFVDAPPEEEDSEPFVQVAARLGAHGLNVPRVIDADLAAGFMMLSDLGDDLYLDHVREYEKADNELAVERLYADAFSSLVRIQKIPAIDLPAYDDRLLRQEMDLFPEWFLAEQLGMALDEKEFDLLMQVSELLIDNALAQPVVLVHRDYHSRNLMVTSRQNPGILDFQDAVYGPVTYDLVSLLKDCYVRFPASRIHKWVEDYRYLAIQEGIVAPSISSATFKRWFDLMGLQRHLKCAGIFSRLHLRDGKARYLGDVPLVVDYIREVCDQYGELAPFRIWMNERVVPLLEADPEFTVRR